MRATILVGTQLIWSLRHFIFMATPNHPPGQWHLQVPPMLSKPASHSKLGNAPHHAHKATSTSARTAAVPTMGIPRAQRNPLLHRVLVGRANLYSLHLPLVLTHQMLFNSLPVLAHPHPSTLPMTCLSPSTHCHILSCFYLALNHHHAPIWTHTSILLLLQQVASHVFPACW